MIERRCSTPRRLLFLAALVTASSPAAAATPSPDGKQLAYSFIGGPENIYLMNADGSGSRPLVAREIRDFRPEWAPDGSHLVFTSVVDGVHVISRVNRDGSGLERISELEEAAGDPDYSPDGTRLVYFTDEPRPRDLFVRDVKTGEIEALTRTAGFEETSPRWSPDGKRIVFVGKKAGEEAESDIWMIHLGTGERRNLTSTPDVGEFHPDWSHDGGRVIYIHVAGGRFGVAIRDLDSGEETVVASGRGYAVLSPHFAPDDRSITFTRTDFAEKGPGMPAIVRVSLADGGETTLAKGLYLSQMNDDGP